MVKRYTFSSNTLTVKHPYGGLIFLTSHDRNPPSETATFTFDGVEKAIHFKKGVTTEAEWDTMRTANLAPKAELESEHFINTVARKNLADLTFAEVTDLANGFDEVAINSNDFYGFDRNCSANISDFTKHTPPTCQTRKGYKHRQVFDPHISIGAGHSGYPLMVMTWNPFSSRFPQNPRNSWLLWHELGHNTATKWLTLPGSTEVANNVMCLYQQHKFNLPLRTAQRMSSVDILVNKGQSYGDSGAFGRLLMFAQIPLWVEANYFTEFKDNNPKYYSGGSPKSEYGFLDNSAWDIYKIMHREAREDNSSADYRYKACAKDINLNTTESFATCTSSILGLDLISFMQSWEAGTVGTGMIDGVATYDSTGGLTSAGETALSDMSLPAPSSAIEEFK
jgi:accessory colonization factor AcfD